MSEKSEEYRLRAAQELRKVRNSWSVLDKADHAKRAFALKALACEEEWLAGERLRSELHCANGSIRAH
jgi:hypothetical protein